MKNKPFASIKRYIMECSRDDEIWWFAFLFIDMTPRQLEEVRKICIARGFEMRGDEVVLPSGIGLKKQRW